MTDGVKKIDLFFLIFMIRIKRYQFSKNGNEYGDGCKNDGCKNGDVQEVFG